VPRAQRSPTSPRATTRTPPRRRWQAGCLSGSQCHPLPPEITPASGTTTSFTINDAGTYSVDYQLDVTGSFGRTVTATVLDGIATENNLTSTATFAATPVSLAHGGLLHLNAGDAITVVLTTSNGSSVNVVDGSITLERIF
jgi:hypothetical protein